MDTMTKSLTSNSFTCRLVNSYGDGHNHELEQYRQVCQILDSVNRSRSMQGQLLGNVMCGNVSLDSLLLTPFGVFVFEYKNYRGNVTTIRIDGQRNFLCLAGDGSQVTDTNGSTLKVKGGTYANPYEQAKANRRVVRETLCKCFGRDIYVGVAILFNGNTKIEGSNPISEPWLSVMGMDSLAAFLNYVRADKTTGLTPSEQDTFISYLDANMDILPQVDFTAQAGTLCSMGKYAEAYKLLKHKCDPTRRETALLTMGALYNMRNSTDFPKVISEYIQSSDEKVKDMAYTYYGSALYSGRNGFREDYREALKCFKAIKYPNKEVSEMIASLTERCRIADLEARRSHIQYENGETRKSLMNESKNDFRNASRTASSVMFLVGVIFCLCAFLPLAVGKQLVISILLSIVGGGFLCWMYWKCKEDNDDYDHWFFKDSAASHFYHHSFRIIKVNGSDNEPWSIIKAVLYGVAYITFLTIPAIISYKLLSWIRIVSSETEIYQSAAQWIFDNTGIHLFSYIISFMVAYLVVHIVWYVIAFLNQACDNTSTMKEMRNDRFNSYTVAALPELLSGGKLKWSMTLDLCRRGLLYGAVLSIILSFIGFVKPYIYILMR